MSRLQPRSTVTVEGKNGYALSLHELSDDETTAVITGIATGKRHANVSLTPEAQLDLLSWLASRWNIELPEGISR